MGDLYRENGNIIDIRDPLIKTPPQLCDELAYPPRLAVLRKYTDNALKQGNYYRKDAIGHGCNGEGTQYIV